MGGIQSAFKKMGKVFELLANPVKLVSLVAASLAVVALRIVMLVLGLPPMVLIPFIPYYVCTSVIPFVAYTVLYGVLLALTSLACLVLTGVDYVTGGAIRKLITCQNGATGWFETPNFQRGNRFRRGFWCSQDCSTRYVKNPHGTCVPLDPATPAYCAQAEIQRVWTGRGTVDGVFRYGDASSTVAYGKASPADREELLKANFLARGSFRRSCADAMSPYDDATKGVCASFSSDPGLSRRQKDRLRAACADAYCADAAYPFCKNANATTSRTSASAYLYGIVAPAVLAGGIVFLVWLHLRGDGGVPPPGPLPSRG